MKTSVLSAAYGILLLGAVHACGDILHLENGDKLRGAVELQGDRYRIVTEAGEELFFTKAEVKRWQYVSALTPGQALEMLEELQRLVVPVLTKEEPEQFQWLADVRKTTSEYDYHSEGGRLTVSRRVSDKSGGYSDEVGATRSAGWETGGGTSSSETRSSKERELKIDDVFADEWSRYIADFEMLAEDPRYQELVGRRKRSVCLGDFANYAAEEYKDVRLAVRTALASIDAVFQQADKSKGMVQGIIRKRIELQDDILKATNDVEKARDRLARADAAERDAARRKLHAAEDKERELVRKQKTGSATLELSARRSMQDFSKQQALATNALQRSIELLHGDFETRKSQDGPAGDEAEDVPTDQPGDEGGESEPGA